MNESDQSAPEQRRGFGAKTLLRRCLRACAWVGGGMAMLLALAVLLLFLLLNRVPSEYPLPANLLEPPARTNYDAYGLDGFDSPYLGHTGSWDGKGGNMWGDSKIPEMDRESAMGLRWTFMPVHWSALEPRGPVDLEQRVPSAWRALDAFVVSAQERRLNILMQAPVVGGNAGGPPRWAERREPGKSAPVNMAALADFAGKLADRYRPGGVLATQRGWGDRFGVRAWELDNEPEMYRTHWEGQAADYAEFVTLAAARIRAADPRAVIVAPGMSAGKGGLAWLEGALDPATPLASPAVRAQGKPYSIGPVVDVVSLHNYEGLDSAFNRAPRTIGQVLGDVRAVFDHWANRAPGFTFPPKRDFWHTEGNFDFIGALSARRRAAWRIQFFTRAFAAGLRKVCVMDVCEPEQAAVRAYVETLPWPFPMRVADERAKILQGQAAVFHHADGEAPSAGQVWVLWAIADTGDARVEVPVTGEHVLIVHVDGSQTTAPAPGHRLTVDLGGDRKVAPPILVVDRPTDGVGGPGSKN